MNELKHISKLVKLILDQDEKARNSDSYLYLRVIGILAAKKKINIHKISVAAFLMNMTVWGFPPFESVRRSRQKIQAECPELLGNKKVTAARAEKEIEYREFAKGGVINA